MCRPLAPWWAVVKTVIFLQCHALALAPCFSPSAGAGTGRWSGNFTDLVSRYLGPSYLRPGIDFVVHLQCFWGEPSWGGGGGHLIKVGQPSMCFTMMMMRLEDEGSCWSFSFSVLLSNRSIFSKMWAIQYPLLNLHLDKTKIYKDDIITNLGRSALGATWDF